MQFFGKSFGSIWLSAALVVSAGCVSHARQEDARRAGEKEIRSLVERTNAAVVNGDRATFWRYYAPNAALALPGRPITYGVATMNKGGFPKGYALRMETVKAEVFGAGDVGYAFGTYTQTSPNAKTGVLTNSAGKWMSFFKKQPDGSWAAVADTYNVDPAP